MTNKKTVFTDEDVMNNLLEWFDGDALAANVVFTKYLMRDLDGNLVEDGVPMMMRRLAREFARVTGVDEEEIYEAFVSFHIIPQGSPLSAVGNDHQVMSLSNCFVIPSPADSYGGIMFADQQLAQIYKRRGGCGLDLSTLRPRGAATSNAAKTSDGIQIFMDRFSNTTRETAQCIEENELVLTDSGLKAIKDVSPGEDRVWTRKGWVDVLDKLSSEKEVHEIKTKAGYGVKASLDHVFLRTKEFETEEVRLGDFAEGDSVLLVTGCPDRPREARDDLEGTFYETIPGGRDPIVYKKPEVFTDSFAYLLGYSYGDGSIELDKFGEAVNWTMAVEEKRPALKAKLLECGVKAFGKEATIRSGDGAVERISLGSKDICHFLSENQILKQKSEDISMPEKIIEATSEIQVAFLAGYFDADGYASGRKKGYVFTSVSRGFLESTQKILSSLGILSKIHTEARSDRGWRDLHSLCVVGAYSQKRFRDLFIEHSIKVSENPHVAKRDNWLTHQNFRGAGIKQQDYNYVPGASGYLSTNTHGRLVESGIVLGAPLVQDEVVSVEKVGLAKTYDLVLAEEHLFWCNGFYVHNSGRRGALLESVSVHHPDVEHFITAKTQKLDADGNPLRDFNGHIIPPKVTGANISVRLTDEFMRAVLANGEYEQRFPVDAEEPSTSRMVNAKEIWDLIVDNAWAAAEPGLLFWDTILREGPADAYDEFRSVSTNPCVTGDAIVQTSEGPRAVLDLVGKSFVASHLGGEWQSTGFYSLGTKDVLRVSTDRGSSIKLTPNHKVWLCDETGREFSKEAQDLQLGDELLCNEGRLFVASVEAAGREEVFDCTVIGEGRFLANGIVISNCSEITLNPYDSCRLMVTNLYQFVKNPFTDSAEFDFEKHERYVRLAMRLMDGLIDLELEAVDRILAKVHADPEPEHIKQVEIDLWTNVRRMCERGRRTGLGTTGLGDALAACGVQYGSDESLDLVEDIYRSQAVAAYSETVRMAAEKGSFPAFDLETERSCEFIQRIIGLLDPEDVKKYEKYGRRNIALLTNAPCGSISCMAQVTSGIEPAFLLEMQRNRKVTPDDDHDFVDENGDHWKSYVVRHKGFDDWCEVTGGSSPEESPYHKATANDIDWVASVDLQARAQKWICHAISKTCNLPADATRELVSDVYMRAWESGCKGFTVYRDGSRGMGVLSAAAEEPSAFQPREAPQRPEVLPCDIYHVSVKGEKFTIFVGLMDGKPYEVIGGQTENIHIPTKFKRGELTKTSYKTRPARYDLGYGDDGYIRDVVKVFDDAGYGTHTRLISLGLRHGAKPAFLVEQLQKDPDPSLVSFSRAIARLLKKYIEDGEEARVRMEGCDTPDMCQLAYEEGCVTCKQCGSSKCG